MEISFYLTTPLGRQKLPKVYIKKIFSMCANAGNIVELSTLYKISQEVQYNTGFVIRLDN